MNIITIVLRQSPTGSEGENAIIFGVTRYEGQTSGPRVCVERYWTIEFEQCNVVVLERPIIVGVLDHLGDAPGLRHRVVGGYLEVELAHAYPFRHTAVEDFRFVSFITNKKSVYPLGNGFLRALELTVTLTVTLQSI